MYREHGVRENILWRVDDEAIDWFVLRGGAFKNLKRDRDRRCRSEVFPGLWLDAEAELRDAMPDVESCLPEGLRSGAHADFVRQLNPE